MNCHSRELQIQLRTVELRKAFLDHGIWLSSNAKYERESVAFNDLDQVNRYLSRSLCELSDGRRGNLFLSAIEISGIAAEVPLPRVRTDSVAEVLLETAVRRYLVASLPPRYPRFALTDEMAYAAFWGSPWNGKCVYSGFVESYGPNLPRDQADWRDAVVIFEDGISRLTWIDSDHLYAEGDILGNTGQEDEFGNPIDFSTWTCGFFEGSQLANVIKWAREFLDERASEDVDDD
jgi:hypothetical protein